ncbi:hypothetical protein BKA65DRAFT_592751 [Rhexocercosporidium sp. MPI-PUGE-AT-0058]|nr:hypothetical protein BKA65DRAFT_592751 [Rhexocercosporidium sp. MPI-PUGE-AT-0058]
MEKKERTNVTQACDACRRRKMRCERMTQPGSVVQCKACRSNGCYCTFDLPTNRRGPRAKKHSHMNGQSTPGQELSVPAERAKSISTEVSIPNGLPPIDTISPPDVFHQIMQDYMEFMYPIFPFVHIPTFKKNLANGLHLTDATFFCFIISLCAAVSGMMPERFDHYQTLSAAFKVSYPALRDFIKRVHLVAQRTRDPDMHENATMTSWALAYTMYLSHVCIGQNSSCRIYKAEATAILIDLGCHRWGSYASLNPIETQVRKKAFWITVALHICVRITGESWETLNDHSIFEQADAEDLIVLPIDDEYITEEHVSVPPAGELQITAVGYESLMLVKTMAAITKDPSQPKVTTSTEHSHQFTDTVGSCTCGKLIRTVSPLVVFQDRLCKIRSCLQNLPEQTSAKYRPSPNPKGKEIQIEILRVNMHIEHLWMQHVLIDRLKLASMTMTEAEGGLGRRQLWEMMEDVYLRLLAFLEGVTHMSLAPNGHLLVLKIRQVAASLLDFPPEGDDAQMEIARQAEAYFKRFTASLSRLDCNYTHGQVIDLNISKQEHMAPMPTESGNKPAVEKNEGIL